MKLTSSVVGGMNLDVTGAAESALMMRDSNIGKIRFSAGGVGRNIAEQLAKLGVHTRLFTCVSNDFAGQMLKNDAKIKNIDLKYALKSDENASVYLSIHEPGGDMALAVNDMRLIEGITPQYLASVIAEINRADVCVADANLMPESLMYLFANVTVPIAADPVSCAKIARLKPYFSRLAAFKPNALEAMYITGEKNAMDAARALVDMGVKRAVVSLGDAGVVWADASGAGAIAPEKVFTCQANGAGDAMCAGIAVGAALGESAILCAKRGMQAAHALLKARSQAE